MNILIVEPEINGHHIVMYVRFLIRGLIKKNINFSILTSKKIKEHKSLDILREEKKKIKFYFLDDLEYPKKKNPISLLFFQISNYFKIKKGFETINKKEKFDYIFLTTLDHIDKVVPFFGSPFGKNKFSSIILNPKNHLNKYKLAQFNFKKFIYDFNIKKILKLNYLENLFSNDPLFVQYIKTKYINHSKKIHYFEEPVELNYLKKDNTAKKELKFNSKDFVILIYGAIKNSKSVTDLIQILQKKNLKKNIKVLLCGVQTNEIKDFLKQKKCINLIRENKLKIINKFLNLREEGRVFSASDLVWIVYKEGSFGSSGVLFLAKKSKKPIITSKSGIPYWFNKRFMLGPSIDINNQKQVIKILNKLSYKSSFYNKYKKNIILKSRDNYVKKFYLNILNTLNFFK